jgi:hypothetical protein
MKCKCGRELSDHQASRYYRDDRICWHCQHSAQVKNEELSRAEREHQNQASKDRLNHLLGS